MRPVLAIAKSTIRAAFRSNLVLVLLALLAVTAIILPLVIRGDRTAVGLVQISLTYMLGAIGFLLSLVTVWLGCTVTSDEIEGYQVHLVATKPVARWSSIPASIFVASQLSVRLRMPTAASWAPTWTCWSSRISCC